MNRNMLILLALIFAGCGSDRNSNERDSLMTDSALTDTADMKAAPADTTAMKIDSASYDRSFTH